MVDYPTPFVQTVLLQPDFEVGAISLWYGSIATIPDKWQLCDGSNGTANLKNWFVMGAGGSLPVGASGYTGTHDHEILDGSHSHRVEAGSAVGSGTDYHRDVQQTNLSGITDEANTFPPYYSLAYIQRMR